MPKLNLCCWHPKEILYDTPKRILYQRVQVNPSPMPRTKYCSYHLNKILASTSQKHPVPTLTKLCLANLTQTTSTNFNQTPHNKTQITMFPAAETKPLPEITSQWNQQG
jgi:hypothetical protein